MQESKNSEIIEIESEEIRKRIYLVRGLQVMMDAYLASIYGYETKNFNRQVKSNIARFDEDFMFQLTKEEAENISRCKNFTLNKSTGRGSNLKYLPYVFTEQGIYMLMTVLKGELAVKQSKALIRLFKEMKQYLLANELLFQRLDRLELKQLAVDENFNQIFKQLESPKVNKAVLFFKGQMYDATSCIADLIGKAQESIILIDGYVDKGTLDLLTKKEPQVNVRLYTYQKNYKLTDKEISDFNSQYPKLEIRFSDEFHDRFLILDKSELYHVGASIKDAGKKAFEISLIADRKQLENILMRLAAR